MSSFLTRAQQSVLTSNSWYLESITINGVTTNAPSNSELSIITANFTATSFLSTALTTFQGYNLGQAIIDNTTLNLTDFYYNPNAQGCQIPSNSTFQNDYFWFFGPYNNAAPKNYSITTSGGIQKLTISSNNGHQAVYNNSYLSVDENKLNPKTIAISPNPVTDILHIRNLQNNSELQIIDYTGKVVLIENLNNRKQNYIDVDVQALPIGNYIVVIKNQKAIGNKTSFKFIKK